VRVQEFAVQSDTVVIFLLSRYKRRDRDNAQQRGNELVPHWRIRQHSGIGGSKPDRTVSELGTGANTLNIRIALFRFKCPISPNRVFDASLGALLFETEWETARAVEAGKDTEKLRGVYIRKLQKLIRDSAFGKKLALRFTADHSALE
jgi:hypothetical protein